ncbi:hypothetical protein MMC25_002459 [Agyrium rufum]|nr:hypothetical protein [Agyrium rufum]
MSLFGAPKASSGPSSSSPFANLLAGNQSSQTQQQQQPSTTSNSPFANLLNTNKSQAPTQSGSTLFSGLGQPASQQQPASSNLPFANLLSSTSQAQTQQPTPSLFPGLGHQKSQSSGNLFGSLGGAKPTGATTGTGISSTASAANSGSGNIFGIPTNQTTANTNTNTNINAPVKNISDWPPPGLGQSILGQSQSQQQQGRAADGANAFGSGYFNSLLEKEKLRNKRPYDAGSGVGSATSPFGAVPSLQLGLGDLAKRARQLGTSEKRGFGERGKDSSAHYLLAASGVKPNALSRDLRSSSRPDSSTTASRLQAHQPQQQHREQEEWDPDSHKHIEQMQQRMTQRMIAEGMERAQRDFNAYLEEHIEINREAQRRKIYEHFGLIPKGSKDGLPGSESFLNPVGKGSFGRSAKKGAFAGSKSGRDSMGRSVFGTSGMQKSVIGTPGVGAGNANIFNGDEDEKIASSAPAVQDDRMLRDKQAKFAEKVRSLNIARLKEEPYPLLREFASIESQIGSDTPTYVVDAYKALIEIVKESSDITTFTDPGAVRERQYATEYLDDAPNSAKAIGIRRRIIDGSRTALEKAFFNQLELLISRNPREANTGGVPTAVNKVRGYIRLRNGRKDLAPDKTVLQELEGDYCWALIYYLLRSGYIDEAAAYVVENKVSFNALDRNFITFITTYASSSDHRLPRNLQDRINLEYKQKARNSPENTLDPYRMACYKIVGRCEVSVANLTGIPGGVEDWIWLQFSLAREVNRVEEVAGEVFGLAEVQENIREIGRRHFQKGSDSPGGYGVFFYFQILGGLFEAAIAYLYAHSYAAAVHCAIALDFYGLLRISDFTLAESELLTHTTKQQPQINFGRMIGYYTRDFRTANPEAAVDYLSLFCLNSDLPGPLGKSQTDLCHEALRELVLESRDFALLLGDVEADGTRRKGAIAQRVPILKLRDQQDFLRTVTVQAASIADDNGRITDAVLLYHLADDYDNVITIINRALSDAIAVDIGQESMRLQPLKPREQLQMQQQQKWENRPEYTPGSTLSLAAIDDPATLATEITRIYNSNAMYFERIREINRNTCSILLKLSEAKNLVATGDYHRALELIRSLGILPLNIPSPSHIPSIRQHAQNLSTVPPTVSRLLGPLLLWTMTCISMLREELVRGGMYETPEKKKMAEGLADMAKDLMVFAGLVKLRLGKGVWEGLVGGAGVGIGGGTY